MGCRSAAISLLSGSLGICFDKSPYVLIAIVMIRAVRLSFTLRVQGLKHCGFRGQIRYPE